MTPAATLRAAAKVVREVAAAVPYGPPWGVADDDPRMVVSGDLRPWGAPTVADTGDDRIAAWIALMGADKAEHLAAWLDATADEFDADHRFPVKGVACDCWDRDPALSNALALARSILKGGEHRG